MPYHSPPDDVIAKIRELRAAGMTMQAISNTVGWGMTAVRRYAHGVTCPYKPKLVRPPILNPESGPAMKSQTVPGPRFGESAQCPAPVPEAGGPSCPLPSTRDYTPLVIDSPGHVGFLTDTHIPWHDIKTIESWFQECKRRKVNTILLNGDILDCGGVSDHYREPNETRIEEEIEKGDQFIQWLRSSFPQARLIWREGNHEWRYPRYLANHAPELFGIKQLRIPALLNFDKHGVEWVDDCRTIFLGKLPTLHGHEFRGSGGVMPARWLYLRTNETAICGHFHRSSHHPETRPLSGKVESCWVVGCACHLSPRWLTHNKWNHGYAHVEIFNGGGFEVTNRGFLKDGRVF